MSELATVWYPDERPWREHDGGPNPIGGDELCEAVYDYERTDRQYKSQVSIAKHRIWEHVVAYLTKADSDAWEAAQKVKAADADGWINWWGGERPVPADTMVQVCWRNGEVKENTAENVFSWLHNRYPTGSFCDVVAYRVVKEAKPQPDPDRPLAVGDLVKHVAPGSPVMRVAKVEDADASYETEWWANGELKTGYWVSSELVRVPHE
jgi:hypothetical protein